MLLEHSVALVTGGSRGIGRAIALSLAEAGADVIISFRSAESEAKSVVQRIVDLGRQAAAYQVDVSNFEASQKLVEGALAKFQRLDILVNNAGLTKDTLLMRMSEADWDIVVDTNLKGVFNMSKAAIRPMMSQRSGKIINITSVAGVIGNAGQTNYAASKAGVIGFTKALAKELGSRNIQVNAVAPGLVETDMTAKLTDEQRKALAEHIPLKRTGKAEEIAGLVRFLASHDADYVTGQVICIDGGMVM
ncbi:MAG TPA: 3-oxoacyl-[acyl-carrier-protein] reductase [Bacteroidota bacterium]|nr:3-oxoacyl-[acyl-carrier-protein] reductase [Bacteroidota bacterium]